MCLFGLYFLFHQLQCFGIAPSSRENLSSKISYNKFCEPFQNRFLFFCLERASCTGRAVAFAVAGRGVLGMGFPPTGHFLGLGTFDAKFLHVLVALYFSVGEMSVFAEYDVETQSDNAQSDKDESSEKYFHESNSCSTGYPRAGRWDLCPGCCTRGR